jgi:hypothetical protein
MSVPSAPTISVNAPTAEPLFFSRNMGHMIHIAFETIILSIMSYYFYRKTSTLSNEMKVMEAKISQLELTVKEQKTFINEKISEMVSLVTSQISRSSFQAPPPPRQVYQNFQQYQPIQPSPVQSYPQPSQAPSQPPSQPSQPPPQTPSQPSQPSQSPSQQSQSPSQPSQSPSQQSQSPSQPSQTPTPAPAQQLVKQPVVQNRYSDNMADMSIVVMEVISSNPTPKNEKYSQISVIDEDDTYDTDDETIDMDKELKEELSELSS